MDYSALLEPTLVSRIIQSVEKNALRASYILLRGKWWILLGFIVGAYYAYAIISNVVGDKYNRYVRYAVSYTDKNDPHELSYLREWTIYFREMVERIPIADSMWQSKDTAARREVTAQNYSVSVAYTGASPIAIDQLAQQDSITIRHFAENSFPSGLQLTLTNSKSKKEHSFRLLAMLLSGSGVAIEVMIFLLITSAWPISHRKIKKLGERYLASLPFAWDNRNREMTFLVHTVEYERKKSGHQLLLFTRHAQPGITYEMAAIHAETQRIFVLDLDPGKKGTASGKYEFEAYLSGYTDANSVIETTQDGYDTVYIHIPAAYQHSYLSANQKRLQEFIEILKTRYDVIYLHVPDMSAYQTGFMLMYLQPLVVLVLEDKVGWRPLLLLKNRLAIYQPDILGLVINKDTSGRHDDTLLVKSS